MILKISDTNKLMHGNTHITATVLKNLSQNLKIMCHFKHVFRSLNKGIAYLSLTHGTWEEKLRKNIWNSTYCNQNPNHLGFLPKYKPCNKTTTYTHSNQLASDRRQENTV